MGRASPSEGHVGPGYALGAPGDPRAPLLVADARAPSVADAQVGRRSGDRDHRACVGQGCLHFRRPAKGAGCRAARVLGSLRKYVNERGIAPTARPTDLRSRGLPEGEALQFPRSAPLRPPVRAPT